MKFKKLFALTLVAVFIVGVWASVNIVFTKKAEAWILPPDAIHNIALWACCDWYARNECPEQVRQACFADCYEYGGCNTYPNN